MKEIYATWPQINPLADWPFLVIGILGISLALIMLVMLIIIAVSKKPVFKTEKEEYEKEHDKTKGVAKAPKLRHDKLFTIIIGIVFIMSFIFAGGWSITFKAAAEHGMLDNPKWTELTAPYVLKSIMSSSPADKELPADTKGAIVVITKFGCPVCIETYNSVLTATDRTDAPIYWITTESEIGKALSEEFTIGNAGTALYFFKDPERHATRAEKFILGYMLSENEQDPYPVKDEDAIASLRRTIEIDYGIIILDDSLDVSIDYPYEGERKSV
jgi:hypothetical protein